MQECETKGESQSTDLSPKPLISEETVILGKTPLGRIDQENNETKQRFCLSPNSVDHHPVPQKPWDVSIPMQAKEGSFTLGRPHSCYTKGTEITEVKLQISSGLGLALEWGKLLGAVWGKTPENLLKTPLLDDMPTSITSLQRQVGSPVGVVLQNRRTADLSATEKGCTCVALQEGCLNVHEYSTVRDTAHRLRDRAAEIQHQATNSWRQGRPCPPAPTPPTQAYKLPQPVSSNGLWH
ncbi:hypothetical protein H8959_004211 [Pygathrix nigripes]